MACPHTAYHPLTVHRINTRYSARHPHTLHAARHRDRALNSAPRRASRVCRMCVASWRAGYSPLAGRQDEQLGGRHTRQRVRLGRLRATQPARLQAQYVHGMHTCMVEYDGMQVQRLCACCIITSACSCLRRLEYLSVAARFDGLVTLWDWYATFASLAGVDPAATLGGMSGFSMGLPHGSATARQPLGSPWPPHAPPIPMASSDNGALLSALESRGLTPRSLGPRTLGRRKVPCRDLGRCLVRPCSALVTTQTDHRAARAQLPPIDSIDMSAVPQTIHTSPHGAANMPPRLRH